MGLSTGDWFALNIMIQRKKISDLKKANNLSQTFALFKYPDQVYRLHANLCNQTTSCHGHKNRVTPATISPFDHNDPFPPFSTNNKTGID